MKKFLAFFVSKYFLAALGLLVLGLAIWFVGPLLAFDALRPLESVGLRITLIVLMLGFVLLWLRGLSVTVIGLVAFAILIWQAGPLIKVGGLAPLATEIARVVLIALVLVPYLAWVLIGLGRKLQSDPDWFKAKLGVTFHKADPKLAEEEIKHLDGVLGQALARLRQMRSSARGLARWLEGRRYLYELPWYMIVGNPGAGKTTALLNAGLKFPFADQMDRASRGAEPGTRYAAWWLTNEAVLIDTAGAYVRHDASGNPEKSRAEWLGFLGLLKKHRPRAPINGALVTVNVAEFLALAGPERVKLAADLRGRLQELREKLGVRFPVYVLVTKMDLVAGFEAYFSTLAGETRNQPWGFTLPWRKDAGGAETPEEGEGESLKARCEVELRQLAQRLEAGLTARLRDEFDAGRRRQLSLLPLEFEALVEPLAALLEDLFRDSRFDGTQNATALRGVFFTSAAQAPGVLVANPLTLWQRLYRAFSGKRPEEENAGANRLALVGNRSYFLHDLFHRLIFRESHLVRPNLRWETRFRLLRLAGHALAVVLFIWLVSGFWLSGRENARYLEHVADKVQTLNGRMEQYLAHPDSAQVAAILSEVQDLPTYPGLDLAAPPAAWGFGLYTPDTVLQAGTATYAALEDRLLLPFVLRRMETVLSDAIRQENEDAAYETLRAYLLVHDKERFNARDVNAWVREEWEEGEGDEAFGGNPELLRHLQRLFDGSRTVQAPGAGNEALIREARAFLEGKPSTTRIYERLTDRMMAEGPEDFTLLSAVGPQAGTVFSWRSGASLDQGVPGIFTYAGYHEVFNKRLPEWLQFAFEDDTWVMGRRTSAFQKGGEALLQAAKADGPLASEIRRLYLTEYASRWEDFLADVQVLHGETRGFDLQILRALAAPDSPLTRLAKAAVKETTLSRQLQGEQSLLEKAQAELGKKVNAAVSNLGIRSESRLERRLVDNRFSALREIVTGEADAADKATAGQKAGLESVNAMINDFYTQLVVADNALLANSIPPANGAGAKLRQEAAKLPAPFKGVLSDLVTEGHRKINAGIGQILVSQAEVSIGDFCRKAVEGRYPFVLSDQDVDADDFSRLFSVGGLMDEFFDKNLKAYVDTTTKPWRYKQDAPELPPVAGPSLDAFLRAQKIRDAFFRDPGGKRMSWRADVRVAEMDPLITTLTLDVDGQVQRYAHGPVAPWNISWPGPKGGARAEITADPRVRGDTSTLAAQGPWALFRLLERGRLVPTANAGQLNADYEADGRRFNLEILGATQGNPLGADLLRGFRCPGRTL